MEESIGCKTLKANRARWSFLQRWKLTWLHMSMVSSWCMWFRDDFEAASPPKQHHSFSQHMNYNTNENTLRESGNNRNRDQRQKKSHLFESPIWSLHVIWPHAQVLQASNTRQTMQFHLVQTWPLILDLLWYSNQHGYRFYHVNCNLVWQHPGGYSVQILLQIRL